MRLEQTAHMLVFYRWTRALKAIHLSLDGLGRSVLGVLQRKMEHHALKHEDKWRTLLVLTGPLCRVVCVCSTTVNYPLFCIIVWVLLYVKSVCTCICVRFLFSFACNMFQYCELSPHVCLCVFLLWKSCEYSMFGYVDIQVELYHSAL